MHFRRTATRSTELAGHALAAGDKVVVWFISADFDETQFPDPYRFDIGRTPNDHVAFGRLEPAPLPGRAAGPPGAEGAVRGAAAPAGRRPARGPGRALALQLHQRHQAPTRSRWRGRRRTPRVHVPDQPSSRPASTPATCGRTRSRYHDRDDHPGAAEQDPDRAGRHPRRPVPVDEGEGPLGPVGGVEHRPQAEREGDGGERRPEEDPDERASAHFRSPACSPGEYGPRAQ